MNFMIKSAMASRLLHSEISVREHILARIKHLVEEVDMALYDRGSGIGFVYGNLGDLVRKVQAVGATAKPSLFQMAIERKDAVVRKDSMDQLKDNVQRLQEMHSRLQFMLTELEGLVKKS
jgi:hypothetical protein